METGTEKKENKDLVITTDESQIQLSPEARDALFQLGADLLNKKIDASTQKFIAMVQGEVETQVQAMEKTVKGQKDVLDNHATKQHELLEHDIAVREQYMKKIAESETPQEKAAWMQLLEKQNENLENTYLDNNEKLDKGLENVKQKPKGIIGQFLSRFGL